MAISAAGVLQTPTKSKPVVTPADPADDQNAPQTQDEASALAKVNASQTGQVDSPTLGAGSPSAGDMNLGGGIINGVRAQGDPPPQLWGDPPPTYNDPHNLNSTGSMQVGGVKGGTYADNLKGLAPAPAGTFGTNPGQGGSQMIGDPFHQQNGTNKYFQSQAEADASVANNQAATKKYLDGVPATGTSPFTVGGTPSAPAAPGALPSTPRLGQDLPNVNTPGNPARTDSIKQFWQANNGNPTAIMDAMKQYGVSMGELSGITGIPQEQLAKQLGAPDGFGGYSANTPKIQDVGTPGNPDRSASILNFWNQYKSNPQTIMQAMSQYGVSMDELAGLTGMSPGQLAQQLGAPSGFGGYTAPGSTGATGPASPSTGIINNAISQWNVDGSQTVAGQIKDLLNPNNPLMQQARTGALEQMNSRGLANSSMALSAGDAAAYQAALPIAQADAATYAKSASYNADQKNQFALQGNNISSAQWIAQLQANTSKYNTDVGANTQKTITDMNNQSSQLIKQMDVAQQQWATQFQAANSNLLNSSSQASTLWGNALSQINSINASTTMSPETKTAAIAQVYHGIQQSFHTIQTIMGLKVSDDLEFSGYPGFDSKGNWVGVGSDGKTVGTTPSPSPTPTPAPQYQGNGG